MENDRLCVILSTGDSSSGPSLQSGVIWEIFPCNFFELERKLDLLFADAEKFVFAEDSCEDLSEPAPTGVPS